MGNPQTSLIDKIFDFIKFLLEAILSRLSFEYSSAANGGKSSFSLRFNTI